MSWSGFKKNVGRATTQVMMKTGHVEKTSDREYEVEERRYRTLESASLRLQKEAKGYLDSLRAMTASQMRIAETIDAFYGDSGARDGVSRSYKQAVEDLDAETVKALDGPYRSVDPKLLDHAFDDGDGLFHQEAVNEIEAELNFSASAGKRRHFTHGLAECREEYNGTDRLIEYLYRTTVLEPINRFCAYFPDINECIKKRNHKMLDYDAVRSKVKKLVEKPDKDPGKLPRTEKEQEMVGRTPRSLEQLHEDEELDLSIPNPPGVMEDRSSMEDLQREENEFVQGHSGLEGLRRRSSLISRLPHFRPMSEAPGAMLQRSPSRSLRPSSLLLPPKLRGSPSPSPTLCVSPSKTPSQRPTKLTNRSTTTGAEWLNPTPKQTHHFSSMSSIASSTSPLSGSERKRPPFFRPSELEELMQPLKAEFKRIEANRLAQAKVAYDQLNEQLTNELPQLIDLRVPYLDPSFEALVKIQLRFCAEAYSRMAQVQQYLDASTRDQYASGDLDARVEDVLGQIRDLSIAGTV